MQLVNEAASAADGSTDYQVPLHVYGKPSATLKPLVILPALGLGARFYRPVAEALVDSFGLVVVMEQRGHGDSSLRPSHQCDYGFKEWLEVDIPTAIDFATRECAGQAPYLMGHSLGGHLAAMFVALNPLAVSGLILSACGSPWTKAYTGMSRLQVNILRWLAIPLSKPLGYYPGQRVGFGGKEARGLMTDWSQLAGSNIYAGKGLVENIDAKLGAYTGPALILRYADDPFAPAAAVAAVTQKLKAATVTEHCLSREQLGATAGHNQWARHPAALLPLVQNWLAAKPAV